MKKNSLTTAVVAGIAGVAGFAGLASAVNLNPDGLGQVLIYPYYTVNKGQGTLLSVVNTSEVGKAVKVRFLEGMNSHECLDFNVFLSPYDVWTASLFDLGSSDPAYGTPDYDETLYGPALKTDDNSCTVPLAIRDSGPIEFRTFGLGTVGPQDVSRCREGHFEMITMGDIIPGSDLDAAVTHEQTGNAGEGLPTCDFDFSDVGAVAADLTWATPDPVTGVLSSGGIYGAGSIINVGQGTFFGYNADAIEGFYIGDTLDDDLYTGSGDLLPSLQSTKTAPDNSATAYTFQNGQLITSTYVAANRIDAVSAVFMAQNIYNEYNVSPSIGASTDWVVTFPTKKFYVDPDLGLVTAIEPFFELFHDVVDGNGDVVDGISCTQVGVQIFDREELTRNFVPDVCEISPCPPPDVEPPNSLCYETNVISFQDAGDVSSVLGSRLAKNIAPLGDTGHLILDLNIADEPHSMRPSADGDVYSGLPMTGFAAQNVVNSSIGGSGTLSNYSGLFHHRASRSCTNAGTATGECS